MPTPITSENPVTRAEIVAQENDLEVKQTTPTAAATVQDHMDSAETGPSNAVSLGTVPVPETGESDMLAAQQLASEVSDALAPLADEPSSFSLIPLDQLVLAFERLNILNPDVNSEAQQALADIKSHNRMLDLEFEQRYIEREAEKRDEAAKESKTWLTYVSYVSIWPALADVTGVKAFSYVNYVMSPSVPLAIQLLDKKQRKDEAKKKTEDKRETRDSSFNSAFPEDHPAFALDRIKQQLQADAERQLALIEALTDEDGNPMRSLAKRLGPKLQMAMEALLSLAHTQGNGVMVAQAHQYFREAVLPTLLELDDPHAEWRAELISRYFAGRLKDAVTALVPATAVGAATVALGNTIDQGTPLADVSENNFIQGVANVGNLPLDDLQLTNVRA